MAQEGPSEANGPRDANESSEAKVARAAGHRGPGTPGGSPERPALFFSGPEEFRAWLEANHETAPELWVGLRARHVAERGLTWAQAVPEALCFGWIDSVSQPIDADSRRQRWTPRRPGSNWSAVNVAHVERLLAEGKMRPAGIAAFEARTPERTAIYSYEQSSELPQWVPEQLAADPKAAAFWEQTTASYRRVASRWVTDAKREATRSSRLATLLECCRTGQLIPSQRYGDAPAWLARAAQAAADA